jgi:hypothetical protein
MERMLDGTWVSRRHAFLVIVTGRQRSSPGADDRRPSPSRSR